jgi:hypothetical protein
MLGRDPHGGGDRGGDGADLQVVRARAEAVGEDFR